MNPANIFRKTNKVFARLNNGARYTAVQLNILLDKFAGRKIVIVDLEEPQFLTFLIPIIKDIRSRTGEVVFYGSTLRTYLGMKEFDQLDIPPRKWLTTSWAKKIFSIDIFFSAHIHGLGPKNALKINVFHNQPVKYLCYPKQLLLNYDAHFLMGPLQRKQMEQMIAHYAIPEGKVRLFDIGYPKIDALINRVFKRDVVLKELGLDTLKKTVLYAPSWDDGLSLREFGVNCVKKLLDMDGINVLVKLHPASCVPKDNPSFNFYTGGVEWVREFEQFKKYSNFRFINDHDLNPILSSTDIMVTDVSSVALEFVMLDRPIIFFDCPKFFEQTLKSVYSTYGKIMPSEARTNPMTNAGRNAGLIINGVDDLPNAINETLKHPEAMFKQRQELIRQLVYNPGHGGKVAGREMCKLLKLELSESSYPADKCQQESTNGVSLND